MFLKDTKQRLVLQHKRSNILRESQHDFKISHSGYQSQNTDTKGVRPAHTKQLHHRIGKKHKCEIMNNIKNNPSDTYLLDEAALSYSPECTHPHHICFPIQSSFRNNTDKITATNSPSNCNWYVTYPNVTNIRVKLTTATAFSSSEMSLRSLRRYMAKLCNFAHPSQRLCPWRYTRSMGVLRLL